MGGTGPVVEKGTQGLVARAFSTLMVVALVGSLLMLRSRARSENEMAIRG